MRSARQGISTLQLVYALTIVLMTWVDKLKLHSPTYGAMFCNEIGHMAALLTMHGCAEALAVGCQPAEVYTRDQEISPYWRSSHVCDIHMHVNTGYIQPPLHAS
jgi:hypothetical protein